MADLIITGGSEEEETQEELKYQATTEDEEKFFLMYNMKLSLADVDNLDEDRRKWLIARFVGQKHMEQEMIQQQRMSQQIMSNLGDLRTPPTRR